MITQQATRCGFAAIIGAPNAGKSTLINNVVGTKVSIVSPKVQTTRTRVTGIVIHGQSQIVFVDTPGLFEPNQTKKLEQAIVGNALDGMAEADIVLVLIDVSDKRAISKAKNILKDKTGQFVLVLNKIDKIKRDELLPLAQSLNEQFDFQATFMISGLNGSGVNELVSWLARNIPESPWLFPEDQISDMPERLLAAEITREKLFLKIHDELPYQLTVETENWERFQNGDLKIEQTIYVTRESHKKIILGHQGSMIKIIGQTARKELTEILDCTVHLKLFVKVRNNWLEDPERYRLWNLNPDSNID